MLLSSARSLFSFGRLATIALCLCAMSFLSTVGYGQAINTGELAGNVTDTGNGRIPHAVVILTSEDRGNVTKATANAQGEFRFPDLAVGRYSLNVSAPGFSSFVSNHINIDANAHFRVDAVLKVGSVDASVVVNADAVSVDTQSATVQTVIDNDLVENLPIDGNNVVALASLLPGVTDVSAPTTFTDENGGATFNASGARNNSNLFLFDGLLWNNLYLNTGINYPNHAVLQQVSVQLNNFSAQYGRNAGSIFNVVSKSGTNQVHGELFLHYQDSIFDAKNYFSKTKPPQHTYQFGGAVGAPIIHDKLFFEAEYQSLIGYSAVQANAETLTPAEAGLNADGTPLRCTAPKLIALGFTNCASFAGDAKTPALVNSLIGNPLFASPSSSFGTQPAVANSQINSTWIAQGHTGISPCITALTNLGTGYLVNAEIPSICIDPTVSAIVKAGLIPVPDTVLGTSQYLYSSAQAPKPQHEYGGFARLDYILNSRQTMAFRFYRTDNSDLAANGGANADTGVPTYEVDRNAAYITAGSVSHTFVLNANMVNNATLGYKRYEYGVDPSDNRTLSSFGSTFQYPGVQSLPNLVINTRFNLGNALDAYTHSINENIEFVDNVNYTHGRHSFQFGTDYLRLQYLNNRTNVGTFRFYGNPGFTNSQAADFIMGLIYSESVGNGQTVAAIQHALYSYAQDTWRITPRLTLSLGVRYELPWTWYQPDGHAATFVRGFQSTVFKNAPANLAFVGDPGVPRSLINTDYTNISPRFGLVYNVGGNGKTVIRIGGGTFYDAIPATIVGQTEPFTYNATYQYPEGSLSNPLYNRPAIPADYTPETAAFTTPYSIIYPDKNYRNSYVMGFNAGIQHQVSKGSIFEMNYLGRFARHLMMPVDQNEAIYDCTGAYYQANPSTYCVTSPTAGYADRVRYPGFNYGGQGVVDLLTEATANYNALQVIYTQRAYRNLTMLANYTYSRTLDEQSTLSTSNSTPQPSRIGTQYGPSDQNTTHIFNMGWRLKLPNRRYGSAVIRGVANNWSFNGTYNIRSGHPFNVTFGGDELGNDEPSQRAYLNPGYSATLPSGRHRIDKINSWFNNDPNAWRKPDAFTAGNIGRNALIGPAYINTTFSLMKGIQFTRIREGMHGDFRVEAFNVFNSINLGQPRANYSSSAAQASTFGSINSGGANPNRRVQFGFILYF